MTDIDLIHERLAPINAAMPQVLTTARDGAMRAMNTMGLPRHEYRALYANNFIGVARNTMPDVLEECDWEIAAARNTLQLVDKDTGLRVRLLKRFAIEGAVPRLDTTPHVGRHGANSHCWTSSHPAKSRSRQSTWCSSGTRKAASCPAPPTYPRKQADSPTRPKRK